MNTYSDEHLDYWSDMWLALNLRENGVTLEQFLHEPSRYTERGASDGFRPLLPKQRRIAADLIEKEAERGVEHLPRRNGAIIQPLHHNAHPRNSRPFFMPKAKTEEPQS